MVLWLVLVQERRLPISPVFVEPASDARARG